MIRAESSGGAKTPGRKKSLRFLLFFLLTLIILGGGVGLYSYYLEPVWLEVNTVPLAFPDLPPAFEGFSIVMLGDFHFEDYLNKKYMRGVFERVRQLQGDMIVLTGDYINYRISPLYEWLTELKRLEAPYGVYSVLGNHDHIPDAGEITRLLQSAGVEVLVNSSRQITRGGDSLSLLGLDSIWMGEPDFELTTRDLPESGFEILICHEPDFADIACLQGIELQLSGHSHGGQVDLFFFGPPLLPPGAEKYYRGLYRLDELQLYVNRGVGLLDAPAVRFNSRPEITVLVLKRL